MKEVGWVSMTTTDKGEKGKENEGRGRGKVVDEPSPNRSSHLHPSSSPESIS
jgi:hypothetical protein